MPSIQYIKDLGFQIWRRHAMGPMEAPHSHNDIEINFILRGNVTYLHGGTIHHIKHHQFAMFWAGVPHQTLSSNAEEVIWITLPLTWFLQWRLSRDFQNRVLRGELVIETDPQAGNTDLERLEQWLRDFQHGSEGEHHTLLLELEARLSRLALTHRLGRRRGQGTEVHFPGGVQIGKITFFIVTHYHENIHVQDIADAVGLNPKYLMRLFKKHCGISVWDYLTHVRVSHVQRLLITTDMKVLDVAFDAGFLSAPSFYQAFKKYNGPLNPKAYRRKFKGVPRI